MKFIQKLRAFYRSWKLIRLIDPKKLEEINVILENIYPGIRDEIQKLVERHDIHAISKTLQYINTHGGPQKMADYYNTTDENGKEAMLLAFNRAFKPGAPFEDAVLTLDGIAKQKGLGLYTQLIGDVKDSIVTTSIQLHYRTVDDWRTFVRRQHEANKDVLLGILDEIKENDAAVQETITEEANAAQPENQPDNQADKKEDEEAEYAFPMDLFAELYEYDNKVFKHISSDFEFASIIKRKPHKEKLAECTGKRVLVYHILWRLRNLLPDNQKDIWIEDIAAECGYKVEIISRKYKDDTNMKSENKKLLKELTSLFDDYDTRK